MVVMVEATAVGTGEVMVMVTAVDMAGGMDMAIHPAMATCHRPEERFALYAGQ